MKCLNCYAEINENDNYCYNCGAIVIKERITIKSLFSNLLDAFGWERGFFLTFRSLIFKPQLVVKEYIDGSRKKYANPFSFLIINLAISLFIFSQFSEQFMQLATGVGMNQTEITDTHISTESTEGISKKSSIQIKQAELNHKIAELQLKYYNLISFLLLPVYTLIAFFVFRKPYNYGEHLVINTFIHGILLFFSILLFIFCIISGIDIFIIGSLSVTFFYYCFTYKTLYKLTFGKLLLKILKFIGVVIIFYIPAAILIAIFYFLE